MNKWKTLAIVSICLLILIGGYFGVNKFGNYTYNQGVKDAQYSLAYVQTQQSILFYINQTNGVDNMKWGELCGE